MRMSSMVLAACVLAHIAVILYAVHGGLTAGQILARTRGNWPFAAFYSVFVLACAIHVPAGLEAVAEEWLGWSGRAARGAAWAVALAILILGLRAVYGVVSA